MREPRNTRNNGEVESGGVDFNAETQRRRGWEVRRVKTILQPHKKLVGKHCNKYDLLSLTLRGVVKRDMENPEGKFPASFETYQEVLPGDFIFCMFDNEETPRAVGLSNLRGMITGAYDVMSIVNEDINHDFLNYYLLYIDNGKRLKPLYKGLRKTVPLDSFLSYKIPLPPLSEQKAIVEYLDVETGRIDKAIAAEEKMIALLQERREIVINEAVGGSGSESWKCGSEGIDFNAEAQRRRVRRGWEVSTIRRCFTITLGKMLCSNKLSDEYTLEKYFCAADVHFGDLTTTCNKEMWFSRKEKEQYIIRNGDLLIVEGGAGAGGACVVEGLKENFYIQNSILRLRSRGNMSERFVCYVLEGLVKRGYIDMVCNKATIPHFTKEKVGEVPIPLPPLSEQEEIVKYLDAETGKIDRAIEVKRRQIELLRERRQIVIDEAVTGKVKVA